MDIHAQVLMIDDEREFRQLIVTALAKHGIEVLEAADGKEGLRLAAERLPDLILCDLMMPGMNGYEVLAALRRDERLADIPVIFLTAQSEPAEVRQGMNLGADDYLTKPAHLQDLLDAIEVRLKRRQAGRHTQERQMQQAMQLFAETVHDLRDPLFAVLTYTNLLQNPGGAPPRSREKSAQIYAAMQQAATRMQDIISETMFVVRSRMLRPPLVPAAFDLRDFCELLLADHEPAGRLQFRCGEGPFLVVADAPRLRHALENLLANALKYSEAPVQVSLTRVPPGYRIEVRDRGIGIPIEEQARIFEPFFRASNTKTKSGHGLGLCVVQTCIEDHGGSIRFFSAPDQGTTFSIDLPAEPPSQVGPGTVEEAGMPGAKVPAPIPRRSPGGHLLESRATTGADNPNRGEQAPPEPPESPPGEKRLDAELPAPGTEPEAPGKLRALIVEDDVIVRNALRELLENSNEVQVLGEAGTVAQARLLVRQLKPAVLFLDVNLPDGSGFDVLPGLHPNVAVVFVTSAEEYAAQAFECEATDYLVKPVSSERLQKALLRVRQRRAGRSPGGPPADSGLTDSFLVKTLTEKRLVKTSEIKSVIAYGEYSWVYWDKCKQGALLRKSLKKWESELPGNQFLRVHRRAIINLAFIDRIERLPASRVQIYLRDMPEPILASLNRTPVLNRKLKELRT